MDKVQLLLVQGLNGSDLKFQLLDFEWERNNNLIIVHGVYIFTFFVGVYFISPRPPVKFLSVQTTIDIHT